MMRELATQGDAGHPVLDAPGWWRRKDRLVWIPVGARRASEGLGPHSPARTRPLLITGGSGRLGQAVVRGCVARGLPYRAPSRAALDITDPGAVRAALELHRPWAMVNAAGFARPAAAEMDPEACRRINLDGSAVLAAACAAAGIQLLAWSTHLVFDGCQRQPYLEGDAPAPRSLYAASKLESEQVVLTTCPQALVVRAGPLFAPCDRGKMAALALHTVPRGRHFKAADDVTISPSYLPHLIAAALDLLIDGECGIWHLANQGAITHADFARALFRGARLAVDWVRGVPATQIGWLAPRPVYSVLGSSRGALMPSLDQAMADYFEAAPEDSRAPPRALPEILPPAERTGVHEAAHSPETSTGSATPTTSVLIEAAP
jgi:dTDP-4-dehydrorhamnose reductase